MEETKTEFTLANYSPEEASKNMDDSRLVGVSADGYAESRSQFSEQVASAKAPARSDVATTKMVRGNRSVASIIKPDNETFKKSSQTLENLGLGFVDDMWQRGKAQFNLTDLSYQKSQIGDEYLKSGKLTNKQRFQKRSYDKKIAELSERTGNSASLLSSEGVKGIVSSIVPTIVESATAVAREPIAAATGTALGTVPGAVAGGLPGAVAGTAGGFFRFGVPAASAVDTWRRTRGELALDLEEHRTPDGKKIPFRTIRNISNGVGVAASAVDFVGLNKILKTTSWFASKVGAQTFAKRTADYAAGKLVPASQLERKWFDIVIELGKSGITEGTTEVAQDLFQSFGKSLGQSFNGTETDFVNAFQGFIRDFNAQQAARTFVTGAAVGTASPVILGTPKAIAKSVTGQVRERRLAKRPAPAPSEAQQKLQTAVQEAQPQQPEMPGAITATRALQFADVLKEVQKLTDSTKLAELQPQARRELLADQYREAGIDGVWVDPQELANPKYDKVRRLFEGAYANDIERNTVFKADPLIVVQTLEEMPDAADTLFQEKPEGLTAQQTVDLKAQMDEKRREILQRPSRFAVDAEGKPLQGPLASPAPMTDQNIDTTEVEAEIDQQLDFAVQYDARKILEADAIQITPEMTDEQIAATLGDQETAQAVVNRMDREIVDTLAGEGDITLIQQTRNRIQDLMDTLPSETAEVSRAEGVLTGSEAINTTEAWFMQQTPIPPDLRPALPEKDVAQIEALYRKAQEDHRNAIMDGASREHQKLIDETEQIALTVNSEMIREELANDPELAIVDEFERSKSFEKEAVDALQIKKKRGYPAYAIDPDLLTETQRERYLEDPKLIERKVFTKGGMTPDEAASYVGAADGDTLLEILSTKPSTDEAVNERVQAREAQIAAESIESVPVDEAAIIKSFESLANFDKSVADMLRNNEWSAFKKIVRQISFTKKTTEEIRVDAEYEIANTRIRDLNLKKYERGAIASRKKAMEAFFRGDLQEAYDQTLNALYNVELQRAASLAVARTNRGTRKISRFFTNRVQGQLKQAGTKYVDAINEIMDVLNLSPYAKGESKQGAYQALAQEMIERGQGDVSMPEYLMNEIDPREPWYNMTTSQYDYITNEMSAILKMARNANKVLADYKKQQVDQTVQIMESTVQVLAEQHPDYDPRKLNSVLNKPLKAREQAWEMFDTFLEGSFGNIQAVTTHLDQGKPDGLFTSIFWNTLLGKGDKEGPYGTGAKLQYLSEFQNTFKKALKKYGSLKLKTSSKEVINVVQFANNPKLRNGQLTKAELLGMALHIGNESNMDRLMNYDISKETIWEVMNEHLTTEDMDFIQEAVWNVFDATKERVIALEKLDGRDIQLIEPRAFQFKGKTYAGGWMHLEYKSEESGTRGLREWVKSFTRKDGELNEEQLAAFQITRGMTKQGYTKERTGSDQLPILNFGTVAYTMDMVANDLAMRIPIREVSKLMTNRKIRDSIISVVGKAAYQTMINGTFHLTMSDDARRIKHQLQSEALLDRIFTNMEQMEAINALGGRMTSILMQFQSFGALIERMGGANGLKHLSKVATIMAVPWNYNKIPYFYQLAKEIDPAIGDVARSVETYQRGGVSHLMPTDEWGPKPFNMLKWTTQWGVERIMSIFSITDLNVNGLGALAAYSQFMAGEAPGQDRQALIAMSQEERRAAARKYASDLTDFTLTRNTDAHRSEFQKSILGKRITRYFNDIRAQFNSNLQSHRQYRYALNEAAEIAREGDLTTAAEKFTDAGSQLLNMILLGVAMTAYESLVRSRFGTGEDEEDEFMKLAADMTARRFLPLPIVKDILFSAETGRPASIPALNFMTKAALTATGTVSAAGNYIEGMDIIDALASMSKREQQAVASMLGNVVGGVPINGPWKWADAATDPEAKNVDPELLVLGATGLLIQRMKEFIEKFKDDPKMKGTVEAVKKDQAAMETQPEAFEGVTDDYLDALREAENPVVAGDPASGKWDTKNPYSNAFGFYQITPTTWADIYRFAPDSLGLTEDGLYTDESGDQARRGARFWLDRNAQKLMERGIVPTPGALYGFWHFGLSGWTKIAKAAPDTPKEDVASQAAFNANPWMNQEKIKTAQDIIDFVDRRMANASKKVVSN